MKFLLDMPVSGELIPWLHTLGHVAVHAANVGLSTADDADILAIAQANGQVLITADLDFARLMALGGRESPAVILFRGGNYTNVEMRSLLNRVLDSVDESRIACSFIVVDRSRVRVRPLPLIPQPLGNGVPPT